MCAMAKSLEELKILQIAEIVADAVWKQVVSWDVFARDTVDSQMARAADSIGANIAESFGRFHYGEKVQFLYYARGSLFETKYWLNRARERNLLTTDLVQKFSEQLTDLARQMNMFIGSIKSLRRSDLADKKSKRIRELQTVYQTNDSPDWPDELFTKSDLEWLITLPEVEQ
jgi:four helix bundle protein